MLWSRTCSTASESPRVGWDGTARFSVCSSRAELGFPLPNVSFPLLHRFVNEKFIGRISSIQTEWPDRVGEFRRTVSFQTPTRAIRKKMFFYNVRHCTSCLPSYCRVRTFGQLRETVTKRNWNRHFVRMAKADQVACRLMRDAIRIIVVNYGTHLGSF